MKGTKTNKKTVPNKYSDRPSPPVSAQDHKNKTMVGNDGKNYKSEKDKNGIFRWKAVNMFDKYLKDINIRIIGDDIKTSYPTKKHYMIHDNGDRPFYVEIFDNEIKIFKSFELKEETEEYYNAFKFYKTFQYEKVFVGKSPLNEMTKFSGGHGKAFDGNSVLVKLKSKTPSYLYIGSEIYTFTTDEEIIKYESSVGNNDVPYPLAWTKNNIYLMTEYAYFPKVLLKGNKDPYSVYFGNNDTSIILDKKKVKKLKIKKIHKRHNS